MGGLRSKDLDESIYKDTHESASSRSLQSNTMMHFHMSGHPVRPTVQPSLSYSEGNARTCDERSEANERGRRRREVEGAAEGK